LHYSTSWTDLTDVTKVRKSLGAAPCRKHHLDQTDFYTLPVIVDYAPATKQVIGDSFEIAVYLDEAYPSSCQLFPDSTATSSYREFNTQVDTVFTQFVVLAMHTMPLNPETAAKSRAEFCRRAPKKDWEEFAIRGQQRTAMLDQFEEALGQLAELYAEKSSGIRLTGGATPTYADFIVGGWLWMLKETLPEWEMMRTWQDGLWGKLHDTLMKTYGRGD
jgi:glutathione S-transferase